MHYNYYAQKLVILPSHMIKCYLVPVTKLKCLYTIAITRHYVIYNYCVNITLYLLLSLIDCKTYLYIIHRIYKAIWPNKNIIVIAI